MPLLATARNLRRVALLALSLAAWCALTPSRAAAQSEFYVASQRELAGAPGTIIRQERMGDAPLGASAYRILYRSVGMHGEPIAVSGVIIVPAGPAPEHGRPVVAWAHPTSGVAPRCAPSLALFLFRQIQGLRLMLERGYVVAATDYPGLGTPGPHPYLVGTSEAHAVIDSVRAARGLTQAGAGRDFVVWGHSQGGHAALFTGILTHTYAPDLRLLGVAAAAPATDLAALLTDDFNTDGGRSLTAMTLWSWSRVYGASLDAVLAPAAVANVNIIASECVESLFDLIEHRVAARPLRKRFLTVENITQVQPWRHLLAVNTPGPLPQSTPLFLAQGTNDNLVVPAVTEAYRQRQCAAGSRVQFFSMPGVGHGFAARDSAGAAVEWMAGRFAHQPAPDNCSR